ncbi:Copine-9 [Liparis tanakae]|uniref:Copine-9 n=1 Tax=Liparis tanakae TaxID=230148 RepID=A0A4Z2EM17_9TELE|nr:Copine-9 [Liparis tanakae]
MLTAFTICHKTEVVKNNLDPVWQAFKIPVRALCNGDYDRGAMTPSASHRPADIVLSRTAVLNPKKKGKKKKKYQNSGTVSQQNVSEIHERFEPEGRL